MFCKGADTVILERVDHKLTPNHITASTTTHLEKFSMEGLRTLLLASKDIDESFYESWSEKYHEVITNIDEIDKKNKGNLFVTYPTFFFHYAVFIY